MILILTPFAHMIVYSIKSTQFNTLRRLIYGFALIYPIFLARMSYKWKGDNRSLIRHNDGYNSDDDNKSWDDYSRAYKIFGKIITQILSLLVCKREQIRSYSIKFAAQMVLHITNDSPTNDINKFSLKNIKPNHPILNEDKLINNAKMWLKELAEPLNQPRTEANKLTRFSKENISICIKKLFKVAEDRIRVCYILCFCV